MTFTISDPGQSPPLRNPHPLSGSETLEPTPLPIDPHRSLPGVGSNYSPARRLVLSRWPSEPEAGSYGRLPRPRAPFDRLQWWTVKHELTRRLKPYQATVVSLTFRQASWATLVMWSQLLDVIEIEEPVKV